MAIVFNMKLRKVKYRLYEYPGFDPYRTPEENEKVLKESEWQEGWFHCWTEIMDSSNYERSIIEKYALVETNEGDLIPVAYYNLSFVDLPNEK